MSADPLSAEERILRMVKKVLTDIAKDTYTPPGLQHPLTENTILNIRECLREISARERELSEAAGRPMNMRPQFTDEKPASPVVVPFDLNSLKKKPTDGDNHH